MRTPSKAALHSTTVAWCLTTWCLTTGSAQTSGAGGGAKPQPATAAPTVAAKQAAKKPSCSIVGASVSAGLAWRRHETHSPDPEPIVFAERILKRVIEPREYDLRTDSTPIAVLMQRLDSKGRIKVRNHANIILRNPIPTLTNQLRLASRKSRLVVGLDLMIWFGYGQVPRLKRGASKADRIANRAHQRMKLQARGFALIDKFMQGNESIFVIGDYPDLRRSNKILLRPNYRPTDSVLAELNRRLHAFAAKRKRVVIFPMRRILESALRHELEIVIDGKTRKLRTADVMQFDEIHPNNLGVALLLTYVTALVNKEVPQVADCLPSLPDLKSLLGEVGFKVEDLDYLATRGK